MEYLQLQETSRGRSLDGTLLTIPYKPYMLAILHRAHHCNDHVVLLRTKARWVRIHNWSWSTRWHRWKPEKILRVKRVNTSDSVLFIYRANGCSNFLKLERPFYWNKAKNGEGTYMQRGSQIRHNIGRPIHLEIDENTQTKPILIPFHISVWRNSAITDNLARFLIDLI